MPDSEFGSDGQVAEQNELASADAFEASEPGSAAQRLRDFEHEHLGEDVVRNKLGHVERGSGSLFQRMPADRRYAHALIEKSVETEQKLAEAHTALLAAEADHEAALAAAQDASRFGG